MEPVKVVIRYHDGRVLKGFTNDFFPKKSVFHVGDGPSGKGSQVSINDLKAIFFVKDFGGNPEYDERKDFPEGKGFQGRKVKVIFQDGEIIVGTVLGYDPQRQGFFLVPSDDQSNNMRMFVVTAAMDNLRFV
jgi:hypothetical protein